MVVTNGSPLKKVQQLWHDRLQQLPQSPTLAVAVDDEIKISSKLTINNDTGITDSIVANDEFTTPAVPSTINNEQLTPDADPPPSAKDQHSNSTPSESDDADRTLVSEVQEKVDISLLYEQMGKLTENLKEVMHNTAAIPGMQTSIAELQVEVKTRLADLSGRMIVAEEEITKMKKDISSNSDYLAQFVKPLVKQINRHKLVETVVENSAKISNLETEDENLTLKYELDEEEIESAIERVLSSKLDDINQRISNFSSTDIPAQLTTLQQDTASKLQKLSNDIEKIVTVDGELLDRVSKLENAAKPSKKQQSTPPAAKPPDKPTPATIDHDFVIIGDSNTTTIRMKDIALDMKRKRFTCYTIPAAAEFIRSAIITSQPKKVLLHVGTNDIVSAGGNVEQLTTNFRILFDEARRRFPDARIFVSTIFTRKSRTDRLNRPIKEMNSILENICDSTPKMTLVDNSNIGHTDMYDPKHIDNVGLDTFLWNIRHTVLGEAPRGQQTRRKEYSRKW